MEAENKKVKIVDEEKEMSYDEYTRRNEEKRVVNQTKGIRTSFLELKSETFVNTLGYHKSNLTFYKSKIIMLSDYDGERMKKYVDFLREMEDFGYNEFEVIAGIHAASFSDLKAVE